MVERSYVRGTWQKERSFSPAVITKGGNRTIWLAGHAASMDKHGKPFVGDFAAQVRRTFEYMSETMKEENADFIRRWREIVYGIRGRMVCRTSHPSQSRSSGCKKDQIIARLPYTQPGLHIVRPGA